MTRVFLQILVAWVSLALTDAESNPEPAVSVYSPFVAYRPAIKRHEKPTVVPVCASNTTKTWCLEDSEYPEEDLKLALKYHYYGVLSLHKDVALSTENSVERLTTLEEETYLCPSETSYVKPLRAQNTKGKWRVIINDIKVYKNSLTQTVRTEECLTLDQPCPLVPHCYDTKCLQKNIYHRFLVYDPYDYYFPFAVETFKLPASCACFIGSFSL